mmetsp:Transcript_38868/g.109987  ORF Transcript_38868/g.109987 Transcript_38868/m.109987 type:complete len:143 (+) Transcript_38868:1596-2024(+)
MVFNAISVAGWNSLDLITPELYPSVVRCTATGAMGVIGRIGSVAGNAQAAWLIDLASWAPLLVSSAFMVAGTLAVLRLPETARKTLDTPCDGKFHVESRGELPADGFLEMEPDGRMLDHNIHRRNSVDGREGQHLLQQQPPS